MATEKHEKIKTVSESESKFCMWVWMLTGENKACSNIFKLPCYAFNRIKEIDTRGSTAISSHKLTNWVVWNLGKGGSLIKTQLSHTSSFRQIDKQQSKFYGK